LQQGDKIGQISDYWSFWAVFLITEEAPICWASFFHGTSYVLILAKKIWATSWATFSPTHLVTLFCKHSECFYKQFVTTELRQKSEC
jgi:hypothetical protein